MDSWSRAITGFATIGLLLVGGAPEAVGAPRSAPSAAAAPGHFVPAIVTIRPAPPTQFRAVVTTPAVICPASFAQAVGPVCVKVLFGWNQAGVGASFRIYHGFTGEGKDQLCTHQLKHSTFLIGASAGARHRTWYQETDLTGAGTECYWIEAVNPAGHSRLVPPVGQT